MKFLYHIAAAASLVMLSGCTDLDETLYDQVGSENYYNTCLVYTSDAADD